MTKTPQQIKNEVEKKFRRVWVRGYYRGIKLKVFVKLGKKKFPATKYVKRWINPHWRKFYLK